MGIRRKELKGQENKETIEAWVGGAEVGWKVGTATCGCYVLGEN